MRRKKSVSPTGKVVGTLRHGVSVKGTYEGEVRLRVGNLEAWRDDDHLFKMTALEATELGVRLVTEAAKARIERERYIERKRNSARQARLRAYQAAQAQIAATSA